jgi:glucose-1-phosphate cytidylyltransferase
MVEIGGKPILWHIMKIFSHHGISEFIVCAGYRGAVIKEYFLNYEALNNDFTIHLGNKHDIVFHDSHLESEWRVTVVDTGLDTQTGGRIKRIEPYIDGDTFVASYGDGLADIDVARLVAFHGSHGRLATATAVNPVSRFGVLTLADDGAVESFNEKPRMTEWVSGGFFVFEPGVFDYLDEDCTLEQEPLVNLSKDGQLMAYRHTGFWQPMDTHREFTLLNDLWERNPPWKVWAG